MQESILEGRSQGNAIQSFGIHPHNFLWMDEDYFNGRGLILYDLHQWLHHDGVDLFCKIEEVKSLGGFLKVPSHGGKQFAKENQSCLQRQWWWVHFKGL